MSLSSTASSQVSDDNSVNVLVNVSVMYVTVLSGWCLLMYALYSSSSKTLRTVGGLVATIFFLVSLFFTYRVTRRAGEHSKGLAVFIVLNVIAAHSAGVFFGRWMFLPNDDESDDEKKASAKHSMIGVCVSLGLGIILLIVVCVWTASIVSSLATEK